MIYAIDFDGTLCVDAYPAIREPREGVISAVLDAQRAGDRFILWTCRIGERLEEAVNDNLPDMIALYGAGKCSRTAISTTATSGTFWGWSRENWID